MYSVMQGGGGRWEGFLPPPCDVIHFLTKLGYNTLLLQNVCKQFPDCDIKRQTFKFACLDDESDPAIRIEFDNRLKFGWIAGRVNLRDEVSNSVLMCTHLGQS